MIAGLEDPTDGIIRIGDRIVNECRSEGSATSQWCSRATRLPAHDGAPQHRVPAAHAKLRPRNVASSCRKRRVSSGSRICSTNPGSCRAGSDGSLPGDRLWAGSVPDGRTALEPRRKSSRRARRARRAAPAPREDDRVRHPRPGRGDDDGDAHRDPRPWSSTDGPPQEVYVRRRTSSSRRSSAARR